MKTVGIVAEYNPFHTGHQRQLAVIRELTGEDTALVIAMSGDFVQRGEAALYSKYARAEAAVRCGASLVLELPLPWCLSSAEGFARGGVGMLLSTGAVDALSFGSECGDADALARCASVIEGEDVLEATRAFLKDGMSFPAAREKAVALCFGAETAAPLSSPNDLLAVEYIKAARRLGTLPELLPIHRTDSRHDGAGSASELRTRLAGGEDILPLLPPEAAEVFRRENGAGRGAVTAEGLCIPLTALLRMAPKERFAALPDATEGIENRLYAAARTAVSPEEIAQSAKSKRYALSRLRRMTLCAALGVGRGMADGTPPFLRVLASDEKGLALLRKMKKTAKIPVVIKPACLRGTEYESAFDLGSRAHDIYTLGWENAENRSGGEDWRHSPFILHNGD